MNGKFRNLSQVSPSQQNQAQSITQKCGSIQNLSIAPSIPPFGQGARIRPRYPWHIWRQYPVTVEECYLASTIWLIKVQVLANPIFSATVLASDFERTGEWLGIKPLGIKPLTSN